MSPTRSWLPCRPSYGRHSQAPSPARANRDRKSTRLNSSHLVISYAVFCLKKHFRIFLMSRKIILIKQELLLLVYELNRSGLLAENEKIRPILAQLEKLLLCDLSPSTNDSVKN